MTVSPTLRSGEPESNENVFPTSLAALPPYPPRILLAEDDDAMREMVASALRKDGFDVVEARDAGELVDYIEALTNGRGSGCDSIAGIVSDVRMPGMPGTDVIAALRNAGWDVPVVLVTAFGSRAVHERAAALGAAILDKPFTLESLRALVRARIARSH